MTKSGWCMPGPINAPKHKACRWDLCRCSCHGETAAREGETGGECGRIRRAGAGSNLRTGSNPAQLDHTEEPG